jgi:predicted nucleic acid-binding protein
MERRKLRVEPFMAYFSSLANVIQTVEVEAYSGFETIARQRLERRDENDWPILAAALALRCPIWTEDTDFFGCGVATWTTDRVELYLDDSASEDAVEQ